MVSKKNILKKRFDDNKSYFKYFNKHPEHTIIKVEISKNMVICIYKAGQKPVLTTKESKKQRIMKKNILEENRSFIEKFMKNN